jgi:inner membrane protein
MRTSALARLAVMGVLMFLLMFPLLLVYSLVSERAHTRAVAAHEIAGFHGGAQTLGGPVLTIPYRTVWTDNEGKLREAVHRAHFLPEELTVEGVLEPAIRERGIFEVVVFRAVLRVTGRFPVPDLSQLRPVPEEPLWSDASLSVGVSDPKGIARRMTVNLDGAEEVFTPGAPDVDLFAAGVQARVRGLTPDRRPLAFEIAVELNGTGELGFLPGGNETTVRLTSTWPHPGFIGGPLPESRDVSGAGFTAAWNVPYFGRGYPASWTSASGNREQLRAQASASAFGVSLVQPIDIYRQAERAVKYAALFIVMTFVIFFLWEVMGGALLHPVQYLLVGFALCVFYLLLLSLAEHAGFDAAYAIAACSTIGLIAGYWGLVLRSLRPGLGLGAALTALYGFLYMLLRLEDYALLAGSVGLFATLALLMYVTRRVDWYSLRLGASDSEDAAYGKVR